MAFDRVSDALQLTAILHLRYGLHSLLFQKLFDNKKCGNPTKTAALRLMPANGEEIPPIDPFFMA